VLSYRVTLDVPIQLAVFVSRLLAGHRRELGTRTGTRALTCWKQAVFALAWFRDRPDIRRLGAGFGISQATAYRYKDEAIAVLAAKAPSLKEALDTAVERGLAYLILDGTLVSCDRCAGIKTSKKGKEIDAWYSGKAHEPAGNIQAFCERGRPAGDASFIANIDKKKSAERHDDEKICGRCGGIALFWRCSCSGVQRNVEKQNA